MRYEEVPLVFSCDHCRLIGIVTLPDTPRGIGIVIVVGGPQYRAGSHRQFTSLARDMAEYGIPSLRFDYRGMGDSEGARRTFDDVQEDIRAGIDAFLAAVPNVHSIVLWGLCDAASAILFYGHNDSRVCGLALLNPWVHTEQGAARARFRHYYLQRFLQKSFWIKLLSGQVRIAGSLIDLGQATRHFVAGKLGLPFETDSNEQHENASYIDRMLLGLKLFNGRVLIILSGNDIVSQEFQELYLTDNAWATAISTSRVETKMLPEANHTFSSRSMRGDVSRLTLEWMDTLTSAGSSDA